LWVIESALLFDGATKKTIILPLVPPKFAADSSQWQNH